MSDLPSPESFEPNWVVPPGATIAEILASRSLSRENLAESLGANVETIQRLLLGLEPVSDVLAERLSGCLGSSKAFWTAREAQYRSDCERLRLREAAVSREIWVKQFPVREMVNFGWIRDFRSPTEAALECLRLFDVPDVPAWHARYAGTAAAAAFRMSASVRSHPGAVSVWLRWAELVAGRIPCTGWDPRTFRERLDCVRRLTWKKDPATFLPTLRRLCAEAGVAVIVARTPKGCPASGATRFLSPNKAMMVLSFRYRSDDHFWFTFFHEAGHLLLHGPQALFLEDEGDVTSDEEEEANAFAEAMLVPPEHAPELLELRLDRGAIAHFARRIGIAPGLVVGQLQHKGRLARNQFNQLKRAYVWDQIVADRLIP